MYTNEDFEKEAVHSAILEGYKFLGVYAIIHALYFKGGEVYHKKTHYKIKSNFILNSKLFEMIADTISPFQSHFSNEVFRKNCMEVLDSNYIDAKKNSKFNYGVRHIKNMDQAAKKLTEVVGLV